MPRQTDSEGCDTSGTQPLIGSVARRPRRALRFCQRSTGISELLCSWKGLMNVSHTHENLLLIEDNPADAMLIRKMLADPRVGPFQVEWVENLSDGLERLSKGGIVAIVADLSLPDSRGLDTLDRLLLAAPRVPILVVSGLDDEYMGSKAVQHGAQDYLPKGHLDRYTLSRALRTCSSARQRKPSCSRKRNMPKSRLTRFVTEFSVRTVRAR